jgi:hypothetical protein
MNFYTKILFIFIAIFLAGTLPIVKAGNFNIDIEN